MGDPHVIIRRRDAAGAIDRSDRIDRYWKCKSNGEDVMVVRYLRTIGPANFERRVIFVTESMPTRELSLERAEFEKLHEPIGNLSDKF